MGLYDEDPVENKRLEHLRAAENEAATGPDTGKFERKELGNLEKGLGSDALGVKDQLGKGYTGGGTAGKGGLKDALSPAKQLKAKYKNMSMRQKVGAWIAIGTFVAGVGAGGFSLFNFSNLFQLDHLMSNVERHGFRRYQVDMEGRSKRWINAYLTLRLAEVEDPKLNPKDRDNILFRSNTIDSKNPALAWYKLMRASKLSPLGDYISQFEEDLYERHGIKFGSIGCKGQIVDKKCVPGGDVVRFRPAIITIKDAEIPFELTKAEIKAIEDGNVNGFNNRLSQFIDVEVLESDKAGRERLGAKIFETANGYSALKRWMVRKGIQNMTGIRDWRFFEDTRNQFREDLTEVMNKIIVKSMPESMRAGKYVQCFFGITSCKTTTDPSNPENKSPIAPDAVDCLASSDPNCSLGDIDEDGKADQKSGNVGKAVTEGLDEAAEAGEKRVSRIIMSHVLGPVAVAADLVEAIDLLNSMNEKIRDKSMTNAIAMQRAQFATGMFTTFGIMRDQLRTGDESITDQEVQQVMRSMEGAGSSEVWETVITKGDTDIVSAAGYEPEPNKEKYCGVEHQEEMIKPENYEAAKSEYHYLCEHQKIGGDSNGKSIEDGWNAYIGPVLTPLLLQYNYLGGKYIYKFASSVFGKILEATTALQRIALEAALEASGGQEQLDNLVAWAITKGLTVLGAVPPDEFSPPGVKTNYISMGAAAAAETAARNQGAALTTASSQAETQQRIIAYMEEEQAQMSNFERYLSLDNHQSAASQGFFALLDNGVRETFASTLGSIFNGSLFAKRSSAATATGYELAKISGIDTYDLPSFCSNGTIPADLKKIKPWELDPNDPRRNYWPLHATPLSVTNADDLNLIPEEEITWDLVRISESFYNRLYRDDVQNEKPKEVYNCALADSGLRNALIAATNSQGLDENAYGYGFSGGLEPAGAIGDIPTGTPQQLAQQILDHDNIDFQVKPRQENAMKRIAQTGKASNCGSPTVSSTLLGVILAIAEKYKIVIGVLVDGHACDSGFHPKGMAVDINGVNPLTGSGGTGRRISWSISEQPILRRFYNDIGPLLTQAGGGGLGQSDCFAGDGPKVSPKVEYFPGDSCTHIHLDVGKR